jgi:hypothetical protein
MLCARVTQILWAHEQGQLINERYGHNRTLPYDDILAVSKVKSIDDVRTTMT